MNSKTLTQWARQDGINPRTAQQARQRANVGEKHGMSYILTPEEWEKVKEKLRGK